MYFLYILKSIYRTRTYIGITSSIERRLREHNNGLVTSTKAYRPYIIVYQEAFRTKTEARKRELELKNHSQKKEVLFKTLGLL